MCLNNAVRVIVAGFDQKLHLIISQIEPSTFKFYGIGCRSLAMLWVMIFVLSLAIMKNCKKFQNTQVSPCLCRNLAGIVKYAQPVLFPMEPIMAKLMRRNQVVKKLSRNRF